MKLALLVLITTSVFAQEFWKAYPLMSTVEVEKRLRCDQPGERYEATPLPFAIEGKLTSVVRKSSPVIQAYLERYQTKHPGKFQMPIRDLMKVYAEEGEFQEEGSKRTMWVPLQKATVAKSRLDANARKKLRMYMGAYGCLDGLPMLLSVDFDAYQESLLRKRK